jgi:hypothetical protein
MRSRISAMCVVALATVALLAYAGTCFADGTNVLLSGSFEDTNLTPDGVYIGVFADPANVANWRMVPLGNRGPDGPDTNWGWVLVGMSDVGVLPQDGNVFLGFNNDTSLEQSFAVTGGTTYSGSFYERRHPSEYEPGGLSWTLTPSAGSLSGEPAGTAAAGSDDWAQFTFSFTPSDTGSVTLNFTISPNPLQNGNGAYLDNVSIVSAAAPKFPGDANGDGTVDISDLSVVLTNYDQTNMGWSQGDFNGDGTVDISDLSNVLTNYDKTAGAAGIKAVPEPGTLALAIAGLGGLLAWVRRRRA